MLLIFLPKIREDIDMALAGISTLGITFGYGVETTAGQKPTSFKQLTRINSIGGITVENEQIDASAIEDKVSRYVQGRGDTGGSFAVGVNFTQETMAEWEEVISEYEEAKNGGKRMWFETIIPGFDEAFFAVAQPPTAIPQPEIGQNELLVIEMGLTIEEYKGMETKVDFVNAQAEE